jgi:protein-tyrosine-phosphatase
MEQKRILFVCDNNLVRSPIVAGAVQKLSDGALICESAGVFVTRIGRTADRRLVEVAQARDIDLRNHQTSSIAPLELERYDGIVVLDSESYFYLDRKRDGRSTPHFHSFSDFVEGSGLSEVPDPITEEISFEELLELVWAPCQRIARHFIAAK